MIDSEAPYWTYQWFYRTVNYQEASVHCFHWQILKLLFCQMSCLMRNQPNSFLPSLLCIRKVFRLLDFLHILLRYSLILKLIKWIQILIDLHTIANNDNAKQVFSCITNDWHKYSDPLLWDLKLSSGASCFHWSSMRCYYNLIGVHLWKFNWLDMIWKGTHLSI
jgi:hypothetical protein